MIKALQRSRPNSCAQGMTWFILAAFLCNFLILPSSIYAQTLPAPGTMVSLSPAFTPAIISGMTIHPENPLQFDFIIDTGDDKLQGNILKKESTKIINYFMATLTIPENEMWVNLSPYEKNRIIADGLAKTEMGRDMLAQDYLLKQLTASLLYPEGETGKAFWQRVYAKTKEKFGNIDVPTDTFNKVWILPQEASVYVNGKNVFVTNSHLQVMLEQDYEALVRSAESLSSAKGAGVTSLRSPVSGIRSQENNAISSQIIREIVIPEIEKEVNEGKNFADLRQIYNSMILATWYKKKLKNSVFDKLYLDKNKTQGIDLADKDTKNKIYNQYLAAFKKGVYNYIKEDIDPTTQETIPRKYFSGGLKGVSKVSEDTRPSTEWIRKKSSSSMVTVSVNSDLLEKSSASSLVEGQAGGSFAAELAQLRERIRSRLGEIKSDPESFWGDGNTVVFENEIEGFSDREPLLHLTRGPDGNLWLHLHIGKKNGVLFKVRKLSAKDTVLTDPMIENPTEQLTAFIPLQDFDQEFHPVIESIVQRAQEAVQRKFTELETHLHDTGEILQLLVEVNDPKDTQAGVAWNMAAAIQKKSLPHLFYEGVPHEGVVERWGGSLSKGIRLDPDGSVNHVDLANNEVDVPMFLGVTVKAELQEDSLPNQRFTVTLNKNGQKIFSEDVLIPSGNTETQVAYAISVKLMAEFNSLFRITQETLHSSLVTLPAFLEKFSDKRSGAKASSSLTTFQQDIEALKEGLNFFRNDKRAYIAFEETADTWTHLTAGPDGLWVHLHGYMKGENEDREMGLIAKLEKFDSDPDKVILSDLWIEMDGSDFIQEDSLIGYENEVNTIIKKAREEVSSEQEELMHHLRTDRGIQYLLAQDMKEKGYRNMRTTVDSQNLFGNDTDGNKQWSGNLSKILVLTADGRIQSKDLANNMAAIPSMFGVYTMAEKQKEKFKISFMKATEGIPDLISSFEISMPSEVTEPEVANAVSVLITIRDSYADPGDLNEKSAWTAAREMISYLRNDSAKIKHDDVLAQAIESMIFFVNASGLPTRGQVQASSTVATPDSDRKESKVKAMLNRFRDKFRSTGDPKVFKSSFEGRMAVETHVARSPDGIWIHLHFDEMESASLLLKIIKLSSEEVILEAPWMEINGEGFIRLADLKGYEEEVKRIIDYAQEAVAAKTKELIPHFKSGSEISYLMPGNMYGTEKLTNMIEPRELFGMMKAKGRNFWNGDLSQTVEYYADGTFKMVKLEKNVVDVPSAWGLLVKAEKSKTGRVGEYDITFINNANGEREEFFSFPFSFSEWDLERMEGEPTEEEVASAIAWPMLVDRLMPPRNSYQAKGFRRSSISYNVSYDVLDVRESGVLNRGQTQASSGVNPGGIDLNSKNLNLKEQGQNDDFEFIFDKFPVLEPANVNGLLPVIINITPVTNFPGLLGLSPEQPQEQISHL